MNWIGRSLFVGLVCAAGHAPLLAQGGSTAAADGQTAAGAQSTAGAQAAVANEVKATLVAMWDAIERGDLETYASFLHSDFSAFGENDPYLAAGRELELAGMAEYLGRATGVHTEMHQPVVTVRGDVAWITYYWTDWGYAGGERFSSRGKSTRIFVREDGRWLCIHGHYTDVP